MKVRAALGCRRRRRPRAFARELYRHAFAVEQPAAESVGCSRLQFSFSMFAWRLLLSLSARHSSAVTPAFRFLPLCRLISSPLQPFWEFLSSVLCGGFLCFAFFSLSSHSVRYFPVVPGYSGVKEISHHTYPTLEISQPYTRVVLV